MRQAAGAAAGGLTFGQIASYAGLAASVGGSLMQGQAEADAAAMNARLAKRQAGVERALSAVEDQRTRERMRGAIAQQRAELAARGVSLDSPTAVLLGQTAAKELSFASQSVRSGAAARDTELTAESRAWRARGTTALLTGKLSAATSLLSKAPTIWPGLADRRVAA